MVMNRLSKFLLFFLLLSSSIPTANAFAATWRSRCEQYHSEKYCQAYLDHCDAELGKCIDVLRTKVFWCGLTTGLEIGLIVDCDHPPYLNSTDPKNDPLRISICEECIRETGFEDGVQTCSTGHSICLANLFAVVKGN